MHKHFVFPKVAYPDRFMHENRQQAMSLRSKASELQKKISLLEENIERFEKYRGNDLPLLTMLGQMHEFFNSQTESPCSLETEFEDLTLYCPENIETDVSRVQALSSAKELLNEYSAQVRGKLEHMCAQRTQFRAELESLFDQDEFKRNAYNLHAILMHEGQASSGHYYVYILDSQQGKWRKYNDIYVTEVSEEEVMLDAQGGKGFSSAYSLVYTNYDLIPRDARSLLRSYSIICQENNLPEDEYSSYIPKGLLREVDQDNRKFMEEVLENKYGALLKRLQDMYSQRYYQAISQWNSSQTAVVKTVKHEIINFSTFLLKNNSEGLMEWQLLDVTLRECDPDHRSLKDLKPGDPLYIGLDTKFRQACKAPLSFTLTNPQEQCLETYLALFFQYHRHAVLSVFLLRQLIASNFTAAVQGVDLLFTLEHQDNEFYSLVLDLIRTLAFRFTSEIISLITEKRVEEAVSTGWLLAKLCEIGIPKQDPSIWVIRERIQFARTCIPKYAREQHTQEIEQAFNNIQRGIEENTANDILNQYTLPEELKQTKCLLCSYDPYQWHEGWKITSIASCYISEFVKLHAAPVRLWWAITMKNRDYQITHKDFALAERQSGLIKF